MPPCQPKRRLSPKRSSLFRGAGYQVIGPKQAARPHAAVASLYAHVTAPLRRLVDRYAAETCLASKQGPSRRSGCSTA